MTSYGRRYDAMQRNERRKYDKGEEEKKKREKKIEEQGRTNTRKNCKFSKEIREKIVYN